MPAHIDIVGGLNPGKEDLRSIAARGGRRFLKPIARAEPALPGFSTAHVAHGIVYACYANPRKNH